MSRSCWFREREIKPTSREAQVLETLLWSCGKVVSKQTLVNHVWGLDFDGDPNIVDVYTHHEQVSPVIVRPVCPVAVLHRKTTQSLLRPSGRGIPPCIPVRFVNLTPTIEQLTRYRALPRNEQHAHFSGEIYPRWVYIEYLRHKID